MGASLGTVVTTLSSTRTPPRLHRVPPPTPASASPHPTAPTRTVPHPTTRRASVGLLDVLQVQDYIATSQKTNVVLSHHALKPMALLQTTQHVNVVLHHALQIQGYTVLLLKTAVHIRHRQHTFQKWRVECVAL